MPPAIAETLQACLAERGFPTDDADAPLELASLDYVWLLMRIEAVLETRVDDAAFFADGVPTTLRGFGAQLEKSVGTAAAG